MAQLQNLCGPQEKLSQPQERRDSICNLTGEKRLHVFVIHFVGEYCRSSDVCCCRFSVHSLPVILRLYCCACIGSHNIIVLLDTEFINVIFLPFLRSESMDVRELFDVYFQLPLLPQLCILKIFNSHKERLARQRRIKVNQCQQPVVSMTKKQVIDQKLFQFVLHPTEDSAIDITSAR